MTKVSVISTIYNGAPYVNTALDSVLNQDYADYEYLIVDDGSTDHTVQLVEEYCRKHTQVKLIQAGRVGRVRALNSAVELSSGEYIANLDIDDIAFPCRLKEQALLLDNNPLLGVVGGAFVIDNKLSKQSFTRYPPTDHHKLTKQLAFMIPFSHSVAMFRKSAWQKVGGYKEMANEDLFLWFEMVKNGFLIGATTEVLGIHYKHSESYWTKNYNLFKRHLDLAKIEIQIIKELKLNPIYLLFPILRLPFFLIPLRGKVFFRSLLTQDIKNI